MCLRLICEKLKNPDPNRFNSSTVSAASERLCVNITSSLIQLLNVTQSSWRQDLRRRLREEGGGTQLEDVRIKSHRRTGSGRSHDQSHDPMMSSQMERGLALLHSVRLVSETRQRSKFIPFLLRNSTGLCLQFATLTSVPSQDTRSLIVHQLLVRVEGWSQIDIPVSVDKIGVFFREVRPSHETKFSPHPPRWLVFAISLSDTCKIINVRSSLVLHNTTELTLDVRLERPFTSSLSSSIAILLPAGVRRWISSAASQRVHGSSTPPGGVGYTSQTPRLGYPVLREEPRLETRQRADSNQPRPHL
ncbi:Vacuolar protein sorting-associated protein 13D [Geodia barretti]|uniref:Vacuolar protein sorting-associated protein 13D n=1 Tax=Geodia barretti TaxID=519541 RepID=A0AA35R229_GEOBA|nr:Vacuolar protein sorting-associated protein 13D [Geodia barretti]